MSATPPSASVSASPAENLSRASYDYMMDRDVPAFLDRICAHLLTERPADPDTSVAQFLRGAAAGNYRGGAIVAGENVGGGWVRVVDSAGVMRVEIDRLNFSPSAGIQLVASCPRDGAILVVVNPPGADTGAVAKYSSTGAHVTTFEFPKAVSCLTVDRHSGAMYVGFAGGGVWVVQQNGSRLRDISTAAPLAICLSGDYMWVLTQKAVERRQLGSGQLDSAIHLPESMNAPCSFAVGQRYLWVAAPNADGTANYVGAFDTVGGRTMPQFVPTSGSWIRYDSHRGGIWQMCRQTNGAMSFFNEKGIKVLTTDMGKNKCFNLTPDMSHDALWVLKVDFADDARLVKYDPLRGVALKEIPMPGTSSAITHLVPA